MLNFALLCKIYNVDAETSQKLSSWSRTSRSPEATSRFVTLLPSAAGTTTVAEMIAAETTVAETTVAGTIDARMAASDLGLAKACGAGAVRGPDVRSRGHGATSDAVDDRKIGKTCVNLVPTLGSSAVNLDHRARSEGHAASSAMRTIRQSRARDVTGRAMVPLALGSLRVVASSPTTAASWTLRTWNHWMLA